ncbi:MAG: hypothetical protein K0S71_2431 [Clostridia bacterium]|jgi:uroporphyrinogen-III decarboxylase|nr:hypothetical protein [Clostridia bacterium]
MIKKDITFHPKWWYKNAGIHFNEEFFNEPDYRIESDIKMRKALYERFGKYGIGEKDPKPRPIIGTNLLAAGYLHSQILGCSIRFSDDNSPEVIAMNADEDFIKNLSYVDLDTNSVFKDTQKQIDFLKEKYGFVQSHVNLMGVQNIAMDIRGQEIFLDYYGETELVHKLLDICTDLCIKVGKRFKALNGEVSSGVTGIVSQTIPDVYLTSNCSCEMVSNDIYEEFLLGYDNKLAAEFTNYGIHHCGKTMEHLIDGYKKVNNITFLEVGAYSDLKQMREAFPNTHLNARFSPLELRVSSEDEIAKQVKELYEAGMPNELLSISCVGIDDEVSDEKIIAFLKACEEL